MFPSPVLVFLVFTFQVLNLEIIIKRDNESAPTKGKELDLASPESNVPFLVNYSTRSSTLCAFADSG